MNYNLEERTRIFSKEIIRFLVKIKKNRINENIISQLIRSATSVGANYFSNKIFICRKEIQETKYWVELLAEASPEEKDNLKKLWKEAHELTLIFNKISKTLKEKNLKLKN
ncbi:MAG: hypothetical protein US37_C0008G0002 [Candidatus Moranbacteria bacterium GW2011_GWF2_37_11]|nr:MAG: hypothetical protein US37_C0008G0002 [Candidatus Moranbacteria bacterium GW2011_GWF2_37_11]